MSSVDSVRKIVEEKVSNINPKYGMISNFFKPNYHSNLKPGNYCGITTSTNTAAAIFSCGYEKYYGIANNLLRNVISLQQKTGNVSGLWQYYAEEKMEDMVAPDHNSADFNAYPMLYILKEHKDKLEDGMYDVIKGACILACEAILRRNLTIIYTNPTVMGIYCTVVCGELFGIEKFIEYGRNKLDKFYYRIMNQNTYDEYNCPGYSMLIANVYSLMLRHIEDPDMHKKTEQLDYIVWKMLGEHYHCELDEFTGPNLRQYVNFSDTKASKTAAGLREDAEDVLSLVHNTKCPDNVFPLFTKKGKVDDFRRLISTGFIYPYLGYPMVDTQFIRPTYTLGSFSMDDCWNQRRNVVSYIGNKEKKVCIRHRTYHNDYDFCSAFVSTAQEGNVALSITNFHTNRGDTHVDLDPVVNATVKAHNLYVLYQIEANCDGIIDGIKSEEYENGCRLEILGTKVEIAFPFMEADGLKPYFEITKTEREMLVKAVLYEGEEKEIKLDALNSLAVVSVISVGEYLSEKVKVEKDSEMLTANFNVGKDMLTVKGPFKPLKQAHSVLLDEVLINGKNIIKVQEES